MSLTQGFEEIQQNVERIVTRSQTKNARRRQRKKGPPPAIPNSNNSSTFKLSLDPYLDFFEMATALPVVNKFVGNLRDRNDPDRIVLESYTVERFLDDVDARISSKKITSDEEKIKEAHLLISSDKGDAKQLVLSLGFKGKT